MNTNSITGLVNLPAQTINAATETVLVNAAGNAAVLSMPAQANVDSHTFRVRLVGKATGGTSATLILGLRLGTTISGTQLAAYTVSGAAIPTTGGNFAVDATLVWDSVSQTVTGVKGGQINGTVTTAATLNNNGASIVAASNLQFVATATFGAALSTNTVTVEEFSLEQV